MPGLTKKTPSREKNRTSSKTPKAAWVAFAIASAFFLYEFVTRVEPGLAAGEIKQSFQLSEVRFGTVSSLFFWV